MLRPPSIFPSQEVLDLFEAFSDGDLHSSDLHSAASAPVGGTVPPRWRAAVKTLKGQDLVVRTQLWWEILRWFDVVSCQVLSQSYTVYIYIYIHIYISIYIPYMDVDKWMQIYLKLDLEV